MAPFLSVRARNFRKENFRFISNSQGVAPTQEDLVRFVRRGSRASHMPAHPQFSEDALFVLADYVREIRRLGVVDEVTRAFLEDEEEFAAEEVEEIAAERMTPGQPSSVPPRPAGYRIDTARGAQLFAKNCAPCHGPRGYGDGTEELLDELGRAIQPRDLSRGDYRGGRSDRDLFWRIRCGLPGTPMPALGSASVTDEEAWQLVDYLRLLVRGN